MWWIAFIIGFGAGMLSGVFCMSLITASKFDHDDEE